MRVIAETVFAAFAALTVFFFIMFARLYVPRELSDFEILYLIMTFVMLGCTINILRWLRGNPQ